MKCDLSKQKLMAYFYEELAESDRTECERHVSKCHACQNEIELLGQTTNILRAWPDEEPNLNLEFVKEKSTAGGWLKLDWLRGPGWRRIGIGVAVGFASLLLLLSLFNLEASYEQGHFSLKLGLFSRGESKPKPSQPDPLAVPVTVREFNAWKQTSYQLIQDMIRESEARQRQENNLLLTKFAKDIDWQRRQDLHLVGRGLEAFQLLNEDKIRRTNQIVNQLLQASYQQRLKPDRLDNR